MEKPPIFIVGCERSGTTLLRLMLHSHPEIAIPPQTKFLKKLWKRRLQFGALEKNQNREKLIQWFSKNHNRNTKLVDLNLDWDKVRTDLNNCPPTLGSFVSVIFRRYSLQQGKIRWGDKRPYYIKYLPQLLSLFPSAKIIHIVRDGRDSVASLKKMPWWKKSSIYSMLNWREAIRNGNKAGKNIPKNQFFELKYEDLVANTETWLRKICQFIDEPFDASMLQFQGTAKTAVPEYKHQWHSQTQNEVTPQSIGRGQLELDQWELEIFNRMARKELAHHGYLADSQVQLPMFRRLQYHVMACGYESQRLFVKWLDRILSWFYLGEIAYRE